MWQDALYFCGMEELYRSYPDNALVHHSVEFSLMVVTFCELLDQNRKYAVAKQLIRSGTAIGALVMEAQSPESNADFIHKLKIADKEAPETWYWLFLCKHAPTYSFNPALPDKLSHIQRILHSILKNR